MSKYIIPAPVHGITADSRKVEKHGLFLAYPGQHSDGRDYIADAIAKGVNTVIWDSEGFDWNPDWQVHNIAIPELKYQVGHIASQFYKNPSEQLWCVGVTGTNGKTTVTHWLAQAYRFLQRQSAVIGTLGNGVLEDLQPTQNTTPGPVELQNMLANFVLDQVQMVAMEVSSHGLDQGRVNGVAFDVAVFTNLTRDHLDYHLTMEAYQAAKRKLFDWQTLSAAVINLDDAFGASLIAELRKQGKTVLSYGLQPEADICATAVTMHATGFEIKVRTPHGIGEVQLHALGQFNVYNALAVLGSLLANQVALPAALQAVSGLVPVAGRMQMFGGGDLPLVVVDYAHTPDALEKALHTLRMQTRGKLTCVFGCGGDRDSGKRSEMGRIADELADLVLMTNDNPRSENPYAIIAAIAEGMRREAAVETDRAKAIALAVSQAGKGDVVLVAGKGHEDYQEIQGIRYPFSDAEWVQSALKKKVNA
ncbi:MULTISPECIES: UDP-N-acetylmuramoyl-L-alanyl-D-glutamate--2,6-diaminopimelate ligase [unclassified Methylophilus]|uniref:UDP-N-acetylmuramoyl-L-alanyl-D-glutamate--2, 6-diaminopimelate ligase n=1 Tax=unclassified Methylophilus TaxID=2630143 RepID=UPI0023B2B175|nr:UDP-N-acetylmuramoyl-L-alanyl-D-glutamate--2,6-diaminopimelate ligase [Methylophilus sp. YYY-1]MDF0378082.1 UDP-N-acetylmuramoyl-L-alanyl-D-glutamate--2,6-diaminopimelate ligase [Methylophilus sp. YYY-1]BEV07072.1 UDP-N-acetylmuramoyl-L-alanyl-D-glutamate--2,6-diaminopimelate ligase [Methylophilus sp. DW102]